MNKTIQKTVVGGLASLILGSGLAFGDNTTKKPEASKSTPLTEEAKAEMLDHLKKMNLDKDMQKQIEDVLKSKEKAQIRVKKIETKTYVMGPDGKMMEADPKNGDVLDLGALLKGQNKEAVQKTSVAVNGKVVVIDKNGKRVEKELKPGEDLNNLIQAALKGKDLEGIDLNELSGNARVFGLGSSAILGNNAGMQELKDDLAKIREEMKAQRELLEKILKK